MDYTELLPPLPELTDEQLADALAEVWADWLMDPNDEHGQPNAIRHVAKAAIAAAAPAIRKAEMERICSLLNGIDKTELQDRDGWWETNAGADFGARILNDIRALPEEPAEQGEKP